MGPRAPGVHVTHALVFTTPAPLLTCTPPINTHTHVALGNTHHSTRAVG